MTDPSQRSTRQLDRGGSWRRGEPRAQGKASLIQVVAYGGRVHRLPMRSGSSFAHLGGGRTVVPVASVDRVRERVEAAYQRLDLPAWPDSHPDGASPSDEEYSPVTDPDRYRIVPRSEERRVGNEFNCYVLGIV